MGKLKDPLIESYSSGPSVFADAMITAPVKRTSMQSKTMKIVE
jgi:hypothetical protein